MTRPAAIRSLLAVCCLLAFATCVGTDVGNPPDDRRVTATLEFAAYDAETDSDESSSTTEQTDNASPRGLVVTGGVDIKAVWMSVESIVVTPADDCSEDAERIIEGPFAVDLIGARTLPAAPVLTESPTEFCAVRMELAPAGQLPEGAPDELDGRSIWLTGTTTGGDPLTIEGSGRRPLRYDAQDFVVDGDDGTEERYIAVFEPMTWLEDVDANPEPGIPVELDDAGAPADLAAFWSAFSQESRLVRDTDDDGVVDPDEFAAPVGTPRL